ncbi:MAG: Nif11-like leader peptide family RiPP precursor [Christensenellaceae bacterium]
MTEKAKEFFEKVCKDSVLYEKMEALKKETDQDKILSETIKLAKEAGYTLCKEDFEPNEGEMDDAEMGAVAGGWKTCGCAVCGGGSADADGDACGCVVVGHGRRANSTTHYRCMCWVGGYGYDLDFDEKNPM